MPTVFDLVYIALLAVAWPIYDYFIEWPKFQRSLLEKPRSARVHEYWRIIFQQWLLVALGVMLWLRAERPWSALGLRAPEGWRLWASVGIVALLAALLARNAAAVARSSEKRAGLRGRVASIGPLLPHTTGEYGWFLLVSLTAGVCEEFLFRGYFIWTLAPWLSWWGAAALSAVAFGLLHAYQGRGGVISTASVGVVMTLVVAVTRSLFPAIALHALVDAGNGLVIWIALKDEPTRGEIPKADSNRDG